MWKQVFTEIGIINLEKTEFNYIGNLKKNTTPWLILFGTVSIYSFLLSDFHPMFIPLAIPHLLCIIFLLGLPLQLVLNSLIVCLCIVIVIQFLFMGLPDSIVGRDMRIAFIKIINSLPTIAPTTCSVLINLFLSWAMPIPVSQAQKEEWGKTIRT